MNNRIEDLKFALKNQDKVIADAQNVRNQIEAVIVKMQGKPGDTQPVDYATNLTATVVKEDEKYRLFIEWDIGTDENLPVTIAYQSNGKIHRAQQYRNNEFKSIRDEFDEVGIGKNTTWKVWLEVLDSERKTDIWRSDVVVAEPYSEAEPEPEPEPDPTPEPDPEPDPEPSPEPEKELKLYPWIRQTFEQFGIDDSLEHYDVHENELEAGRELTLTVVVANDEPPLGANQVRDIPVIFEIGGTKHRKLTGTGGGNTAQQGFIVKPGTTEIPVYIEGEDERFTYKIIGKQEETPEPDKPEDPPNEPKPTPDPLPSTPPPSGTGTQVLMMFMQADKPNLFPPTVDFALNGKWYRVGGKSQNDAIWNVKMSDANGPRGLLVNLDGPLTHLEFNPEQIKVPGLNLWEFGWWNFKILRKDPNANLASPTFSTGGGINFWGNSNGAGRLIGAGGYNRTVEPNKTFYKFSVPASYNTSGKIGIFCNSHGMNNPAFKPFGPNEW